jgi:hypothetical protein
MASGEREILEKRHYFGLRVTAHADAVVRRT